MKRETRARLEAHWAKRLGCDPEFLRDPGLRFVPPPRPGTLYIVHVDPSTVACADAAWEAPLRALGDGRNLVDRGSLESALPDRTRYVGPAFIGYADVLEAPVGATEQLSNASCAALDALRVAASKEEWEHSGLAEHEEPLLAVVRDGVAAAAAGFVRIDDEVAHIGVLCHPAHRNGGLGRRVVAAAAQQALAKGLLPQYQTLWSNVGAMTIGRALGFEHFATTMAAHHP